MVECWCGWCRCGATVTSGVRWVMWWWSARRRAPWRRGPRDGTACAAGLGASMAPSVFALGSALCAPACGLAYAGGRVEAIPLFFRCTRGTPGGFSAPAVCREGGFNPVPRLPTPLCAPPTRHVQMGCGGRVLRAPSTREMTQLPAIAARPVHGLPHTTPSRSDAAANRRGPADAPAVPRTAHAAPSGNGGVIPRATHSHDVHNDSAL